jgi:AcrR family transcriptional regulator
MKKKDKIIQTSLNLFNEHGVSNISTNYISESLNMSVGNLYYYFNNKEDIIRNIFDNYSEEVTTRISTDDFNEIGFAFSTYIDGIFLVMWKYRFFYLNMFSLLQSDEELKASYFKLRHGLTERLRILIEKFIREGLISINTYEIDPFIEQLKFYCTCWMNYEITFNDSIINKNSIYSNIIKLLFLFKLVATTDGKLVISNLERKYLSKMVLS